jgi:protease-4
MVTLLYRIMRKPDKFIVFLLFISTFLLALETPEARAQSIHERIVMPPAGLAASSDPFLIAWNPASMALNAGWEAVYFHSEIQSQTYLAGTGDAAYITSPIFGPLYLGFGLENVRPSSEWKDAWSYGVDRPGNWTMLTFAAAVKLQDIASIGANLRTFVADENKRFDHVTTWDMALNLSVHDISTPYTEMDPGGPVAIERTWGVGIALRPLGRDFLTLSVDNLLGQTSKNDVLRAFIEVKPIRGLAVLGLMEMWFGDIDPMLADEEFEVQASIGLRLDLPNVGIFGAAHMANRLDTPYLGFTAGVRVSGQFYSSLIIPNRYVEVPLDGPLDGEEAVSLLLYMDSISRESSVKGLVLDVDGFKAGPGLIQDMIDGVEHVRKAGKKVFCYEEGIGSLSSVYLCSHADGYFVGPAGGAMVSGVKMKVFYYTGLLRKLGVNAQIFRVGDYKSFPESFTLEGPSEESTEQHKDVLRDIYENLTADIAEGRHFGMADKVIHRDEVKGAIEDRTGKKIILSKKFSFKKIVPDTWAAGRHVGVVVISGTITDGKSRKVPLLGIETAGAETLVHILDKARKNPQIAALVLRVDSGGGSGLASEKIWRAVKRVAEKKPVVASFGGVAASGGYYVAAPATEIYAEPSTITGSIGVFGGKVDISELMQKIGIGVAVFKEGSDKADIDAFYRPFSEEEIGIVKKEINHFYNLFLDRVAEGRSMKKSDVHEIAQGRVWSGTKALGHGLVDHHGGFLDAVARAKKLAKIPAWAPVESLTKQPKGLLTKLLFAALPVKSKNAELADVVQEIVEKSDVSKVVSPMLVAIENNEPLAMSDGVFVWE